MGRGSRAGPKTPQVIRLEFRPAAFLDLEKAAGWYESQRIGLGSEFLDEADCLKLRISENPHQFPVVYRDARRALFDRFPYAVYFRIVRDRALIISVADQRRNPSRWRKRL